MQSLVDHAAAHFGKILYIFRQCKTEFTSKIALRSHLKKNHALGIRSGSYIDLSASYEQDLIRMLESCFSKTQLQPNETLNSQKDEEMLRQ